MAKKEVINNNVQPITLKDKEIKEKIENGILEEVSLKDFKAPNITTYLIYHQNYDIKRFIENRFDNE